MIDNQGERLEQFRVFISTDKKVFVKKIGYSSVTGYDAIVRGDKNVSKSILNELSLKFPKLNLNWLLSGKGEMVIKDDNSNKSDIEERMSNLERQLIRVLNRIETLEEQGEHGLDNSDLKRIAEEKMLRNAAAALKAKGIK